MNDDQLLRYARHLMLPGFGIEGQTTLLQSRALVIGVGGLGSVVALYLASAGVAQVTLVDADVVELSNLQRQIAHTQARIGQPKVASAAQAMADINADVRVQVVPQRADEALLSQWVPQVDVVLDCSDNFATRQAVNAACVTHGKPLVWASALGLDGQTSVYLPPSASTAGSACYACIFPPEEAPAEVACATMGVLAPLVGIMGSVQATEAIKLLIGLGTSLGNRLLMLSGQGMRWNECRLAPRVECPVCGRRHSSEG